MSLANVIYADIFLNPPNPQPSLPTRFAAPTATVGTKARPPSHAAQLATRYDDMRGTSG